MPSGYYYFAFVVAVGVGLGLGVLGRALLRNRVRLSWSDALLAGVAGAAVGSFVAGIERELGTPLPAITAVVSIVTTLAVLLVMERVQSARRVPTGSVDELLSAGESAKVEFKSSARFNRHSGQRDERLERVVVKTVAAFLNAEGGVLLVGVADDGTVPGIDDDYRFMKAPDRDRYELWLRDLLTQSLGAAATALVVVEFHDIDGHDVCAVRVPASPRPVFLRAAKGETATSLVVRVGNSTRELPVDEAVAYCSQRWRRRTLGSAR
jgi:hypothetical protein